MQRKFQGAGRLFAALLVSSCLVATPLKAQDETPTAEIQAEADSTAPSAEPLAKPKTGDEKAQADVQAQAPELPDLLTLQAALSLSNAAHPALLAVQASQARAEAGLLASQASSGWKVNLNLQGRLANRVTLGDSNEEYLDDSRYELSISKLLYDFGTGGLASDAAQKLVDGSALNADYQARLRRISVMARYLDVVAADYQYAADNEAMTLAFFPWNRAKERMERFQSESEVTVLELHSAYLKKLALRNKALQKQRKSRFRLAAAIGWPDAKPASVLEPDLSVYVRPLPDYDELMVEVLEKSPALAQKKLALAAAQSKLEGLGGMMRPKLSLGLYASKFERPRSTTDDHRAMLRLNVPLLDGGSHKSMQASAQAEVYAKHADLSGYEFALREQVMDWVQQLESLEAAIADNDIEMEFRERALDKARLLYEMEVRAQIGRAQGEMAQAIYEGAKARFARAVLWEQIDAVLGAPVVDIN